MVDSASKDKLMGQAKAAHRRRKGQFEGRDGTTGEQESVDHHDGMREEVLTERNMLASVIGAIKDGLTIRDLEYTLTYQNDCVTNIFGNHIGEKCYSVFQGRDTVCEDCPVELAFKDGKSHTSVRKVVLGTGEVTFCRNTANPIRDADGRITSCLEVNTNITEYKQAEETLRQSENKFRTIFETAANLITSANFEGIIVDCNSRVKEVLGYEKEELIGQPAAKIIHPDYLEKANEALQEILSKGHSHNNEYKMVRKNGDLIDVSINSSALRDENGKPVRTICIVDDITERKQARQKLLDDREQLKSLASQLSLTEERERHRLATELHDQIGQSLVFSKLKLDLLRKSASSEELVEALEEVCNNLGEVIDDTRTLTFDLSSPILYELGLEAAVAEWLKDEIQEKHGIEAEFEDDRQPKPLDEDIRTVLFRNVRELLVNIVKHAQARKVKVCVHRADGNIRVSVEDDGVGFDPVDVTSRAAKGAKFGLFSIRQRLEQLGGFIEIDAEPGRGSRISMTAPLKQTDTEDDRQSGR